MDAEERKKNSSEVTVEEWSGSSSSKLSRTATITSLSIRRSGSRFSHVWRRILQAFVPEASALTFFFGARLGFWIDLIEYLDFLKLGHCSENDFLALGSE
ncbi:Protein root UVB sensitive 3 [Vitis vinifera]|uniref:Protein root UVB sensitive 3 n=1 Tax=Vitis vinifera TaxID=29760 RepID=A0A438J0V4_VITVI|nr:Protein root UVB sensitive 3 [Vitis vinifera]